MNFLFFCSPFSAVPASSFLLFFISLGSPFNSLMRAFSSTDAAVPVPDMVAVAVAVMVVMAKTHPYSTG